MKPSSWLTTSWQALPCQTHPTQNRQPQFLSLASLQPLFYINKLIRLFKKYVEKDKFNLFILSRPATYYSVGQKYGEFCFKMKNLYLFIQINFIPYKVNSSRYNALMPTFFPIVETLVKFDFRNCLQSPSSIRLVSFQSCQNGVLGLVFWVWGIARNHTEPNQANMVVVERYALSFWRNGHDERMQCETAHYHDAKTTSCLPKISFETVLSDPLEMPIVSARSLIVNWRFFFVSFCWWSSGAFQVINTFSAFLEVFVPLINIFMRHGQISKGLLQHSERFRNWNFIPQTKFNGTSLLNKYKQVVKIHLSFCPQ